MVINSQKFFEYLCVHNASLMTFTSQDNNFLFFAYSSIYSIQIYQQIKIEINYVE